MNKEPLSGMDFTTFVSKFPHNSNTQDDFIPLVMYAYQLDERGLSLEQFVDKCLDMYGGTIAGAMVQYIINR